MRVRIQRNHSELFGCSRFCGQCGQCGQNVVNVGNVGNVGNVVKNVVNVGNRAKIFTGGGGAAQFPLTALGDPTWTIDGVGEADKKRLLQNYSKCHRVFTRLN